MGETVIERLPKELQSIVYRYIFDAMYRTVVSQYKNTVGFHEGMQGMHFGALYIRRADRFTYFNYRDLQDETEPRFHASVRSIRSHGGVALLPKRYVYTNG
jgi:hypothetical protein